MHSEILFLEMFSIIIEITVTPDKVLQTKQETADLFTFTKDILNGKLYFCAVTGSIHTLKTETETTVDMIQILM